MNESDLKPCPFCGHDAIFEPFEVRKGYEATIHCSNCLALVTTITYDTKEEAETDVVSAWNRRVNEDAPVKLGEWIKKDLNLGDRGLRETVCECSLCEVDFPYRAYQWNYCPNCGAEMKTNDD